MGSKMCFYKRGFSLVEMVCVLAMLSILAAAASIGITRSVEQFNFVKYNDALTQKIQVALNRMLVELSYLDRTKNTMAGNSSSITFPTTLTSGVVSEPNHTFNFINGILYWDTVPLCDEIDSFNLRYQTSAASVATITSPSDLLKIEVTLITNGQQGAKKTFSAEIAMKL
jgi:prepilin-type N-terminal cleavage/methylation domain-containing protein